MSPENLKAVQLFVEELYGLVDTNERVQQAVFQFMYENPGMVEDLTDHMFCPSCEEFSTYYDVDEEHTAYCKECGEAMT